MPVKKPGVSANFGNSAPLLLFRLDGSLFHFAMRQERPLPDFVGVSSGYRAVVGFEHEIQQDHTQGCPEKRREFGAFFGLCSSFSRIALLASRPPSFGYLRTNSRRRGFVPDSTNPKIVSQFSLR
jgi:hypothetical protein